MSSEHNIKEILKKHNLAANKKLGQNFLVNPNTSLRIVEKSGISPDDVIIELGVGFGTLTTHIAQKARQVIGIEIDSGFIEWHRKEKMLPENVTLIHQDLLKSDFREISNDIGAPLKIIANLPYSISNPLLFKLVDHRDIMDWAVLMLQKEVAQRLTAKPGTKEYGVLSVLLGSCAQVETLMNIGPGQFHPRPKVDSQVVRISFDRSLAKIKALPEFDFALFKSIVNRAFQQRRKTLLNALSSGFPALSKIEITGLLEESQISPQIRAEKLTVDDYLRITQAFLKSLNQ
ncbi:MAG: ribosomal RNA small subunit methyltransferase A [Proteobacteria bacterium]|nr:ribosomal RNA small subunit methyltransferase A [Pseudomonadota bacterium]MBU1709336.1 ribosomal RNA small subunit methyltransferase A [Pseudomonadota bacterium]